MLVTRARGSGAISRNFPCTYTYKNRVSKNGYAIFLQYLSSVAPAPFLLILTLIFIQAGDEGLISYEDRIQFVRVRVDWEHGRLSLSAEDFHEGCQDDPNRWDTNIHLCVLVLGQGLRISVILIRMCPLTWFEISIDFG